MKITVKVEEIEIKNIAYDIDEVELRQRAESGDTEAIEALEIINEIRNTGSSYNEYILRDYLVDNADEESSSTTYYEVNVKETFINKED